MNVVQTGKFWKTTFSLEFINHLIFMVGIFNNYFLVIFIDVFAYPKYNTDLVKDSNGNDKRYL